MNKVELKGSERKPMKGAVATSPAHPDERLEVSVYLKPGKGGAIDHVANWAWANGCEVTERSLPKMRLKLSGTVAQLSKLFDTELRHYEHDAGTYRGRVGHLHVPEEHEPHILAVLGLDNRPHAKSHHRARQRHDVASGYLPPQVAEAYQFPSGGAAGQCIGILELGGGYRPLDLRRYFRQLGHPAPDVVSVSVAGGRNAPGGGANGPDGEVMLDIEVAAAIATGAKIAVYFGGNTDQAFVDGIVDATHDTVNQPCALSISWGAPEDQWTVQALAAMQQACAAAVDSGLTITAAAGDNGSSDGEDDGKNHVDYPGSDPNVLCCGGTSLASDGTETVWNDGADGGATGGGYSAVFARPAYQMNAQPNSMRGVPDVAGDADPATGWIIRVDGEETVIGGTSAVAPMWAALIAILNKQLGRRLGLVHPSLYATPASFNAITQGNNGAFAAGPGWNPCCGLGTPIGTAILAALQQSLGRAKAA